MTSSISIGAVAEQTGVSVSAVRYYDEIGMITAVERSGGKRRFSDSTVGRVNFIRRSQEVGFSLNEIRAILDDQQGQWRAVVDNKIEELATRRSQLDEMLDLLVEMRRCGCDVVTTCPRQDA